MAEVNAQTARIGLRNYSVFHNRQLCLYCTRIGFSDGCFAFAWDDVAQIKSWMERRFDEKSSQIRQSEKLVGRTAKL